MATARETVKQGNTFVLTQSLDGARKRFGGSLLGVIAQATVKDDAGNLLCQPPSINLFDTDIERDFTCPAVDTLSWPIGVKLFMDVRLQSADGVVVHSFGTFVIFAERAITTAADNTPTTPDGASGYTRAYNPGFTS